jgi:hypothetical protein
MALALFDRVQETTTTTGTGSVTLAGALPGFQSFAVVGNGNTCYYTIVDVSAWEVGIGTYSTSGPTLARTTILSNSNGNTSPITLVAGVKSVFLTYPAEKSVNLDASDNVSPLGTVSSGVWQGSTVGVAYGGTGVTASSGANSVVLRDSNQNIAVNRVNQSNTNTTAAGGTTALTAASSYIHTLVGTGGQTYTLPDATTLTTGVAFVFNNLATGTLTIANFAGTTIGTIPSGGAGAVFLTLNSTTGGTWDLHAYLPEGVTFGTNAFNLGTSIVSGGTWQGGTIQTAYGGTGLTSYTSGGAVYANSSSTLTSGTLPLTAGGTAATTASGARTSLDVPSTTGSGASGTWGISVTGTSSNITAYTINQNLGTGNQVTFDSVVTGNNGNGTNFRLGDDAWIGDVNLANTTRLQGVQSAASGYLIFGNGDTTALGRAGTGALTYGGNVILNAANYNSYAPTLTGGGASGTWGINITGNSATVGGITPVQFFNNMGNAHSTYTNFNDVGNFGFRYLQGSTNGPNTGATQYYGMTLGLGNEYPISDYATQFYWNRTSTGGNPYVSVRFREAGTWGAWAKIYAGYADSAGSAGSVDYANLTNKGGGTGTYTTSGDYRAPIFYDSNNTAFYLDPGAVGPSATLASSIWVGAQSADGVLWDYGSGGDYRPGMQIRGQYPHIDMVSVVSNSAHGPTLRFMGYDNGSSGAYKHWVVGTAGSNLTFLDFGFASNASNPHEGISGYVGTTLMRLTTSGHVGIGGDWGTYGSDGNPSYPLHVIGVGYSTSSFRAPIFYDSEDTSYYVNPNSFSAFSSLGLTSYIDLTGIFYFRNQQYILNSAANGWNTVVDRNGGDAWIVYGGNSVRAPIFYDSNNTSYYCDPAGTSTLQVIESNGIDVAYTARRDVGANAWSGRIVSTNYSYNVSSFLGSYNGYAGLFGHNASLSAWSPVYINAFGGTAQANVYLGNMYSPIFYDLDNTSRYVDPNGTTNIGALNTTGLTLLGGQLYVSPTNVNTLNSGFAGGTDMWLNYRGQDDGFSQFRNLQIGNGKGNDLFGVNGSGGYVYATNDFRAPIFYDSNNTGFYIDANGSSRLNDALFGNGGADSGIRIAYGSGGGDYARIRFNQDGTNNQTIHVFSTAWQGGNITTSTGCININGVNGVTFGPWNSVSGYVTNGGDAWFRGNVTAYSDEKNKTDWGILSSTFVEQLANIKSGTYTRIDSGERHAGVSAQSWQTLLPETVISDANGLSVAYGNAALVSAVELAKYVTALEQRIQQLEARI